MAARGQGATDSVLKSQSLFARAVRHRRLPQGRYRIISLMGTSSLQPLASTTTPQKRLFSSDPPPPAKLMTKLSASFICVSHNPVTTSRQHSLIHKIYISGRRFAATLASKLISLALKFVTD